MHTIEKEEMIVAETHRLLLAKVNLKDAPFFVDLMNSPKWLQFIGDKNIRSVANARTHLKKTILKSYADNEFGFYKVLLKIENNKTIGISGMVKRETLDEVDMGFGFLPEYEGKGYGYESSMAVLDLAKNTFNLKSISAITNPDNSNSIHLIKKLGMTFQEMVKPFDDDDELMLFSKTL